MYLLDTNVISELRKRKPHLTVFHWVQNTPGELLFLSAVTIGEIQAGIERTRESDSRKADEITEWLGQVVRTHAVLSADAAVFQRWAQLCHRQTDHHLEDALIAATALVHGLTVVTRNVSDFHPFSVPLINPFDR